MMDIGATTTEPRPLSSDRARTRYAEVTESIYAAAAGLDRVGFGMLRRCTLLDRRSQGYEL